MCKCQNVNTYLFLNLHVQSQVLSTDLLHLIHCLLAFIAVSLHYQLLVKLHREFVL